MTKATAKLEHHHRVPGNRSQSILTQKVLLTPELFHTLIRPKASYCNLETASKKAAMISLYFPHRYDYQPIPTSKLYTGEKAMY